MPSGEVSMAMVCYYEGHTSSFSLYIKKILSEQGQSKCDQNLIKVISNVLYCAVMCHKSKTESEGKAKKTT